MDTSELRRRDHRPPLYVRTAEEVVGSAHPARAEEAFTCSTDRSMHLRRRTAAPAVAAPVAPASVARGDLVQTFTPPRFIDSSCWVEKGWRHDSTQPPCSSNPPPPSRTTSPIRPVLAHTLVHSLRAASLTGGYVSRSRLSPDAYRGRGWGRSYRGRVHYRRVLRPLREP